MKETINRIVEMDQRAAGLKKNIEDVLAKSRLSLERDIAQMEKEAMERAEETGRKAYERLVGKSKMEAGRIKEQAERECRKLEEIFGRMHKELEQGILNRIFPGHFPRNV